MLSCVVLAVVIGGGYYNYLLVSNSNLYFTSFNYIVESVDVAGCMYEYYHKSICVSVSLSVSNIGMLTY